MNLEYKRQIIAALILELEKDLGTLTQSALAAREAATHEESKAEDKYDTRGLEASYLAGAQARRADVIRKSIQDLRTLELSSTGEVAGLSSWIKLECDEIESLVFIAPVGGGHHVKVGSDRVQVITPVSPLGTELMGRGVDDEFILTIAGKKRDYRILTIA